MTMTPTTIEAIQIASAEHCADVIFLDCCEELGDAAVEAELREVAIGGVRAGALQFASDRGLSATIAEQLALVAAIAFELRWCRLLLGRLGGLAT